MVLGFNTVYAGVIKNGVLVTDSPRPFVWSIERDAWYNKSLDLSIEWIGYVVGPISYLSSRDYNEVQSWIEANSNL